MNNPLLSILIPTRNRIEYTIFVIEHILRFENKDFELVIYDNSDNPNLQKLLVEKKIATDSRLKYYYNPDILSFVDNFSLGIKNCTGEYLTIIGDDDTVLPSIFEIVEWAKDKKIQAITPSLPIVYYWPQSGVMDTMENGKLTILDFTSKIKSVNPREELHKLLKDGCQNYLSYCMVKAYHGIIKRNLLDEVEKRTGKIIGGLSPDIYLSVSTTIIADKVVCIDYPISISGICKKSGSADSATGRHTGKLEDAPHFRGHKNYVWSNKVPKFYSVETIWGDSALNAINDIEPSLSSSFSVEVISAYCFKKYPEYKETIKANLENNTNIPQRTILFKMLLILGNIQGPYLNLYKRIKNKLFHPKKISFFENVNSIINAVEIAEKEIAKKKKDLISQLNKIK